MGGEVGLPVVEVERRSEKFGSGEERVCYGWRRLFEVGWGMWSGGWD